MNSTTTWSRGRLLRKKFVILGLVGGLLWVTADSVYSNTRAPYGIQPDSPRSIALVSRNTKSRPEEPLGKPTMRPPDTAATRRNFTAREKELEGRRPYLEYSDKAAERGVGPLARQEAFTSNEITATRPRATAAPSQEFDARLDVFLNRRFQIMQGFGSTVRLFDDPHLSETWDPIARRASSLLSRAQQDEIMNLVYGELGLTRIRPATDAEVEKRNDNADPNFTNISRFDFSWKRNDGYIDYVKRAVRMGASTHFLSPIRLEPWMNESNPEEYVEWALTILKRWRELGMEPPYYSIMNEPGYRRGGVWSAEYLRKVVILLGRRLRAENFRTKIVVPDDLNASQAYKRSRVILADPEARQYIGALAYHLYGGAPKDMLRMAQLSSTYDIPVWMTEFSTKGRSYKANAMGWAIIVHDLITKYNVSAIDYMWAFFGDWSEQKWPGNTLILLKFRGNQYKGYEFNPAYYAMRHFSRYVRPGFQRIGATSSLRALKPSAFVKDNQIVVVAINDSREAISVRIVVNGGTAGDRLNGVQSREHAPWEKIGPIEQNAGGFPVELPGQSVTTIFGAIGN